MRICVLVNRFESRTSHQCSFLHDDCNETEHHALTQVLTEEWSSRLYKPGTFLGTS